METFPCRHFHLWNSDQYDIYMESDCEIVIVVFVVVVQDKDPWASPSPSPQLLCSLHSYWLRVITLFYDAWRYHDRSQNTAVDVVVSDTPGWLRSAILFFFPLALLLLPLLLLIHLIRVRLPTKRTCPAMDYWKSAAFSTVSSPTIARFGLGLICFSSIFHFLCFRPLRFFSILI